MTVVVVLYISYILAVGEVLYVAGEDPGVFLFIPSIVHPKVDTEIIRVLDGISLAIDIHRLTRGVRFD